MEISERIKDRYEVVCVVGVGYVKWLGQVKV
jgi:hypothetical protein